MDTNPESKAEAERLVGIAEKLLSNNDLNGAKEFAILAQETDPLLEGSDQISAIVDVLLSSEKRVNSHQDWYAILQVDQQENKEVEAIKKQYRKLALLLHPDKNKYPFADQAFKLVADAWAVFSDADKKTVYDKEINLFAKVDLSAGKLPVRRGRPPKGSSGAGTGAPSVFSGFPRLSTFWTACPYCYHLYEYPRVYEGCCLRCDNCKRAFQAVVVSSMPPTVPGKDAYYCCWGVFPIGFAMGSGAKKATADKAKTGFPHWMPPVFGSAEVNGGVGVEGDGGLPPGFPAQQGNSASGIGAGRTVIDVDAGVGSAPREVRQVRPTPKPGTKKRGRPRKHV